MTTFSIFYRKTSLDEIAITLSLESYDRLEELVDLCEKSGVHTKFIPDYNSLIPGKPYMEDLMGLPVINIRYVPLSNTLSALAKRCVDIARIFFRTDPDIAAFACCGASGESYQQGAGHIQAGKSRAS